MKETLFHYFLYISRTIRGRINAFKYEMKSIGLQTNEKGSNDRKKQNIGMLPQAIFTLLNENQNQRNERFYCK